MNLKLRQPPDQFALHISGPGGTEEATKIARGAKCMPASDKHRRGYVWNQSMLWGSSSCFHAQWYQH